MRKTVIPIVMGFGLMLGVVPRPVDAQLKHTVASVLERQFAYVEQEFLSAAEAMPEDK